METGISHLRRLSHCFTALVQVTSVLWKLFWTITIQKTVSFSGTDRILWNRLQLSYLVSRLVIRKYNFLNFAKWLWNFSQWFFWFRNYFYKLLPLLFVDPASLLMLQSLLSGSLSHHLIRNRCHAMVELRRVYIDACRRQHASQPYWAAKRHWCSGLMNTVKVLVTSCVSDSLLSE
jgi:hypothetical protein